MKDQYVAVDELEKLSHFLHGAHSACDHENSSATFHQAKHQLDEIIMQMKLNKLWVISKSDIIGGSHG
jgi:hypothetical protein